jgi:hypothetical protein
VRLLIVTGGAAGSAESVPASIRSLIDGASEILVIAPTLPSRIDWLASATDKARDRADERLSRVLEQIGEMGASAEGSVGADDPMLAFEEAVQEFRPDHLLVSLRDVDRAGWQERGLLDLIVQRFALPLTVFVATG